ncbi:hypothetical protein AB9_077 [Acinetobacter phage vB_AbaM_B9]|nr:hypothetical protein AB9_077 [Acinetobacter phage vB_AbaM_B9]
MKELFIELAYKKSWGRNEILKLNFDSVLLHNLSSSFEKPVVSRGDAMFYLLCILRKDVLDTNLIMLIKYFKTISSNLDKDEVISACLTYDIDRILLLNFEKTLRARNSKRHLQDKILLCYKDLI